MLALEATTFPSNALISGISVCYKASCDTSTYFQRTAHRLHSRDNGHDICPCNVVHQPWLLRLLPCRKGAEAEVGVHRYTDRYEVLTGMQPVSCGLKYVEVSQLAL